MTVRREIASVVRKSRLGQVDEAAERRIVLKHRSASPRPEC